jgi:hypothetical protein
MSQSTIRLLIVGVVVLAIFAAGWRSSTTRRVRPRAVDPGHLSAGIYLFSSMSCETCRDARRVLDRSFAGRYQEIRFDDDPAGFGRHGIARVPAVLVVGAGGEATLFEGVPRPADLRNAVADGRRRNP